MGGAYFVTLIIVGTYFIVSVFVAAVSGVFLRLRKEHQALLMRVREESQREVLADAIRSFGDDAGDGDDSAHGAAASGGGGDGSRASSYSSSGGGGGKSPSPKKKKKRGSLAQTVGDVVMAALEASRARWGTTRHARRVFHHVVNPRLLS